MIDHPLYQAVVEEPDNDEPRLVFADWMDDCGDPRGEFIRLQIRSADPILTLQQRADLQSIEAEMLRKYQSRWNGPLHKHLQTTANLRCCRRRAPIRRWIYTRGFVSHLTIDAMAFLVHTIQIQKLAPIQHARFLKLETAQDALFRSPCVERLRSISYCPTPAIYGDSADRLVRAIADSQHLAELESLDLSHLQFTRHSALALANSEGLGKLKTLIVNYCGISNVTREILVSRFQSGLKGADTVWFPPVRVTSSGVSIADRLRRLFGR